MRNSRIIRRDVAIKPSRTFVSRSLALTYIFYILTTSVSACSGQSPIYTPGELTKSSANSLKGQTIAGYQGWFTCPDDRTGPGGWGHWLTAEGLPAIDLLPDTTNFPQQAGCAAPFITDSSGAPVMLYSAQNEDTVDAQFASMQKYGLSGVALQRFVSELKTPVLRQARDQVLKNVERAADRHHRVFFITYDISGAGLDWADQIREDWKSLVDARVIDDAWYLHHNGLPVVEIWGVGWNDRPAKPEEAMKLMDFFLSNGDKRLMASVMLGVPAPWRTMTQHEGASPSWRDVFGRASAISPWIIGNFQSPSEERSLVVNVVAPDVAFTRSTHQIYMPVVFPGFSSSNQSHGQQQFDSIPRECGKFLSAQIQSLTVLGVSSLYVAMYDEANEGTAIFEWRLDPVKSGNARFISRDANCADEGDLYMRLVGDAARHIELSAQ